MFSEGNAFNGSSTFSNGNSFGNGQSLASRGKNLEPFFWKYLDGVQDTM